MIPAGAVLVLGGYGTFGSQVSRALAKRGVRVTVAGRDLATAQRFAHGLGEGHTARALDLRDPRSCATALEGHAVLVHAAGPYDSGHVGLVRACVEARCHFVDLAEERRFNALVRALSDHFATAGLTAVHGASSLPGISGALAVVARDRLGAPPESCRVTLYIGNRNQKGAGAIGASLSIAGKPISTLTGELTGYGEPETIPLPAPFGERTGRSFDSPEYDLLPELLGCRHIRVKVAFELGFAGLLLSWVARLPGGRSPRAARLLSAGGGWTSAFGTSGGAVQVELSGGGRNVRAALVADSDGQRMAALPAALAALRLLEPGARPGSMTAPELLGAGPMLDSLVAEGFRLQVDEPRPGA